MTTPDPKTPPGWFDALFRDLTVALQPRRGLAADARVVYWQTLKDLGADNLRAAVVTLKAGRFFPTTGEWRTAAINSFRVQVGVPPLSHCSRCDGRGLIAVRYHDGDAFDLAICDCRFARVFRRIGPDGVRAFVATHLGGRIRLTDENRVGLIEDFAE